MISISGIGIGLSLVFGCLLLAFVAELYYLLWWKKNRVTNRDIEEVDFNNNYAKELFYLFCWKKKEKPSSSSSLSSSSLHINQAQQSIVQNGSSAAAASDIELGSSKDILLKSYGEDDEEEGVASELMRLHNLSGPPRFLFTIKEETKEDLDSDDGKSSKGRSSRKGSRTKSLSDLMVAAIETPVPSPPLKIRTTTSPLKNNNNNTLDCYSHHGFNPLFESSAEAELNRLRSSPPPKFKFLRDAEEKLLKKLLEEAEKKKRVIAKNGIAGGFVEDSSMVKEDEKDGHFITVVHHHHLPLTQHNYHSTSSQVLPLSSSPSSTFRQLNHELP